MEFDELIELQSKIRDELSNRRSSIHNLPWHVEIVDDWVPIVMRRGESYDSREPGRKVTLSFEVLYASNNDSAAGVQQNSLEAAILLCHWLSGVDNEQLREARKGSQQGSFAWFLTHGVEESDIEFEYGPIIIHTQDHGRLSIHATEHNSKSEKMIRTELGVGDKKAVVIAACLLRNEPPSDAELKGNLAEDAMQALRLLL